MDNVTYENGKIVHEYSEAELDAHIANLEETIAELQANLANFQAVKASM
jgi:uncharacterized small protein (DUF1192 family)